MARPITSAPAKPAARPVPKPTQAVATRGAQNVTREADLPKFMQGMRGQGVEQVGMGDIETPRIKLLQAVGDEVTQFDHAKSGNFWHSVAEVSLGETVRIVPVYTDLRAILWRPRHDGGGILARADDNTHWVPPNATFEVKPYKDRPNKVTWRTKPTVAESGLLDWGSSDPSVPDSQPAATKMYTVAVALPDFPDLGVGVLTLQRSAIRAAKKFMGKLKLIAAPSFGCYFNMGRVQDQNPAGDKFWNYTFEAAGFVADEEEFEQYMGLYESFKALGLHIKDIEGLQGEAEHVPADDGGKSGDGKVKY